MKSNFEMDSNRPQYKSLYFKKLTLPLNSYVKRNNQYGNSLMEISENESDESLTDYGGENLERNRQPLLLENTIDIDEEMTDTEIFFDPYNTNSNDKNCDELIFLKTQQTDTCSTDNSDNILPYTYLNNVFFENSKYKCKHLLKDNEKQAVFPRCFQHHIITDADKNHYENVMPFISSLYENNNDFNNRKDLVMTKCKVYKNFQCPLSACEKEKGKKNKEKTETDFDLIEMKNLKNLITWRYSRRIEYNNNNKSNKKQNETTKTKTEFLCRLCKGKNWIENVFFFKHLFHSHGITTSMKENYTQLENSEMINFSKQIDEDGLMIESVDSLEMNRAILKHIDVKLLPLPIRIFTDFKNKVERRHFLQCGTCFKFINCEEFNDKKTKENRSFKSDSETSQYCLNGVYETFYRKHLIGDNCIGFFDNTYIIGVQEI